MVLTDSNGISRAPFYLGSHYRVRVISTTGVSPCVPVLSRTFVYHDSFLLCAGLSVPTKWSHNPAPATSDNYHADTVWPLPLSLATTNGIAVAFSSCGY